MANAYSVARQYNQYQDTMDLGFVNQVLATKQGQYDANMAKVDALIESYTNMPLVRAGDKEILYKNIMSLENEINTFSKMELTSADALRSIGTSLQSAVTPYIAEQFKNSQKVINFQTEMAKKREKNPELWSDANYQYAVDNAGLTDYMNGVDKDGNKVDTLGELVYNDYYDIQKNLEEPMAKHFKEFGYETYYDEMSTDGGLVRVSKEGKRLDASTIQNYIDSRIASDPRLAKQLQINAHSNFRGLSDEQFNQNFLDSTKLQKENWDQIITEQEEKLKQTDQSHPDYQVYQANIELAKSKKTGLQDIIDGKTPLNRKALEFELYTNGIKTGLSNSYSYDRVDKINYSSSPLDVAKYNLDVAKFTANQQNASGSSTNNPFAVPAGQTAGTPFIVDDAEGTKDIPKTVTQQHQENWEMAASDFGMELAKTDPDYLTMTPAQRTQKLNAVLEAVQSGLDMIENPYSPQLIEKAMAYGAARETNLNYRQELNKVWVPRAEQLYRELFNNRNTSELNLNNLATTMPNTVALLRAGKDLSKLTTNERRAVIAETTKNLAENLASTPEERHELETVNYNYSKNLTGPLKEVYDGIGKTSSGISQRLEGAKNILSGGAGAIGNIIAGTTSGLYNAVFEGEGSAKRVFEQRDTNVSQNLDQLGLGLLQFNTAKLTPLQTDRNLSEIQARDLSSSKGVSTLYNEWSQHDKINRRGLEAGLSNVRARQGISFNPNTKADEPYINSIQNVVTAETGMNVAKESTYRIEKQGNNYVIKNVMLQTHNMGGKDDSVVKRTIVTKDVTVPEHRMPPALVQSLGVSETRNLEAMGSNIKPMTIKYSLPRDPSERASKFNKYMQGVGSTLNELQMNSAYQEGFMLSAQEIINPYRANIRTPEQADAVDNLINSDFSATTQHVRGQGFQVVLNVNGKPVNIASPIINTFDVQKFTYQVDQLVKAYITTNVNNIINNG